MDAAAAAREAMIDTLLSWGGKQEERRLALASKLKWESHDSCGLDVSRLTDRQAEERLAYDRCGFIFAMYHADTCVLLRCSAARVLCGGPVHSPSETLTHGVGAGVVCAGGGARSPIWAES